MSIYSLPALSTLHQPDTNNGNIVKLTISFCVKILPAFLVFATLTLLSSQSLSAQTTASPSNNSQIPNRTLVRMEVIQKLDLAPERDGFLGELNLSPGTIVLEGETIATLKSKKVALTVRKLKAEVAALKLTAANDAEYRKAEQAMAVSNYRIAELEKARQVTRIPGLEIQEAKTELKTAVASRDDARTKQLEAAQQMSAKQAELDIAMLELEQSTIRSPFDGIVYQQNKYPGESITTQESIAVIYRLDFLSGNVLLKQSDVSISDVSQLNGSVEVEVSPGKKTSFPFEMIGPVPRIEKDGRYLVAIKIKNSMIEDQNGKKAWALLPGMRGKLIAHAPENKNSGSKSSGMQVAGIADVEISMPENERK